MPAALLDFIAKHELAGEAAQELRAIWTTSVTKAGSGGAAGLKSGTFRAPIGRPASLEAEALPPSERVIPRSLRGLRGLETTHTRAPTHSPTHPPLRLPLPQIPTVRCPLPSPRRPALTQRPTPSHAPPRLLEASTQRAAHCVLAVYRLLYTLG